MTARAWSWGDRHALVDRHFAGARDGGAEQGRGTSAPPAGRLFRHLRRCDRCRARYRAHALLEALAPDGDARARDRLGRTIFPPASVSATEGARVRVGAGGARPAGWWRWLAGGMGLGAAAGAAVLLLLLLPRSGDEVGVRGGGSADGERPALGLYRVAAGGGAPERAGAVVKSGEGLVFFYVNPPGARPWSHLMVFASDQRGRVYWFWPAWQVPAQNPAALPIRPSGERIELGEAVRHALPAGPVTVVGLFIDRAVTVREAEAALGRAGVEGLAVALGGELWTERVEVLP